MQTCYTDYRVCGNMLVFGPYGFSITDEKICISVETCHNYDNNIPFQFSIHDTWYGLQAVTLLFEEI